MFCTPKRAGEWSPWLSACLPGHIALLLFAQRGHHRLSVREEGNCLFNAAFVVVVVMVVVFFFEMVSLLVTFISRCVKAPDKSNLREGGFSLAHSLRDMAHGEGTVSEVCGSVSYRICSQKAEKDGCCCSDRLIQDPSHGLVTPTFQVGLPTLINLT